MPPLSAQLLYSRSAYLGTSRCGHRPSENFLKGHRFSRAVTCVESWASAAEGTRSSSKQRSPSVAKATLMTAAITPRLKAVPLQSRNSPKIRSGFTVFPPWLRLSAFSTPAGSYPEEQRESPQTGHISSLNLQQLRIISKAARSEVIRRAPCDLAVSAMSKSKCRSRTFPEVNPFSALIFPSNCPDSSQFPAAGVRTG